MNPALSGAALGIDQDRQVPADPDRVHVVEEERAVPAHQVLHVVLGGRQQDIHAGVVHEPVEPSGIERNGGDLYSSLHGRLLGPGVVLPAILGETRRRVMRKPDDRA